MLLRNATTGEILASEVRVATGLRERLVGFLNRPEIDRSEGIWFPDCSIIHTLGMRTPIDVVFVDKENRVLRAMRNVGPNRVMVACRGADAVIELGSGALDGSDVLVGDRFILE